LRTCSWWTLAALAACSGSDHPYIARDPCAALAIISHAATPVEHDGISGALALWRDRGVSAFDAAPDPAGPAGAIQVRFDDAASVFHGLYDPDTSSVVINRRITDPTTIAIVVAHELGHVFGLAHVAASARVSLMNPGNVVTPPTDDDQRALEGLWGTCE
jgi:hypothetical protein